VIELLAHPADAQRDEAHTLLRYIHHNENLALLH
jgi:hypothetical protein